jgi:hypothetical protein
MLKRTVLQRVLTGLGKAARLDISNWNQPHAATLNPTKSSTERGELEQTSAPRSRVPSTDLAVSVRLRPVPRERPHTLTHPDTPHFLALAVSLTPAATIWITSPAPMSAHLTVALLLAVAAASARGSDVPSFPLSQAQSPSNSSSPSNASSPPCHLDLSAELFGGVAAACGSSGGPGSLDRGRCCPVLAAWLFAAHARTALSVPPAPAPSAVAGEEGLGPGDDGPMVPYDNQRCVDALGAALEKRGVALPRPNATCDTVLCFCGIRLHQIGSLRCPAAFAVGAGAGAAAKNATPTAAVKGLEKSCRNASYAGCSRCVQSLQKVKPFWLAFSPEIMHIALPHLFCSRLFSHSLPYNL